MKVGDKVEWTKTTRKGGGFHMSQMFGKVMEITDKLARVKLRNGHTKIISKSLLHVSGSGSNQLTSLVGKMAGG